MMESVSPESKALYTITITIDDRIHHHTVSTGYQPEEPPSVKKFSDGQLIFGAGSSAPQAFVILSGSVQMESGSVSRTAEEGTLIGEEAFLDQDYEFTAVAVGECTVEVINTKATMVALGERGSNLVKALSETCQALMAERHGVQFSNLKVRLSNLIEKLMDQEGEEIGEGWWRINRRIKHEAIASMIGARRPTVSAYLSSLRNEGIMREAENGWLEVNRRGMRGFFVRS